MKQGLIFAAIGEAAAGLALLIVPLLKLKGITLPG